MNQKVDPNFKEGMLTILIVLPFLFLITSDPIDKGTVLVAFGTDLWMYVLIRIVFRWKVGRWKW